MRISPLGSDGDRKILKIRVAPGASNGKASVKAYDHCRTSCQSGKPDFKDTIQRTASNS